MKALSVKQPWASMIARGVKTIETRVWATSYRGPLLICASARVDGPAADAFGATDMPLGVALCVVNVVDCRPMTKDDEQAAACGVYDKAKSWVLDDLRAIEPFPVKGHLGIFEVETPRYL